MIKKIHVKNIFVRDFIFKIKSHGIGKEMYKLFIINFAIKKVNVNSLI